ncbi:MAG: V-type ATP synthase subunit F [Candidatus Heimdallarchaeota archaeon LC_3]|nr:MAG: V-type ATP synthase subunit F [Candidatus Heimdallarchaeota archaeon LC_3]OLS27953.1 MAG: V-type ATP synthase subunit F [Candidatus Heimdallarchaeota archaeon LC_3]
MRITAVADEQTCTWLKMSGIGQVYPINDPLEAGDVLKKLAKDIDRAIVLITPEIAKANSRIVQANLAKKDVFPIMLELPIGETSSGLQDLISSALGIEFEL